MSIRKRNAFKRFRVSIAFEMFCVGFSHVLLKLVASEYFRVRTFPVSYNCIPKLVLSYPYGNILIVYSASVIEAQCGSKQNVSF